MTDKSAHEAGLDFGQCVEKIEAAYEYMLAYAAQGRDHEPVGGGSGPSIRTWLADMRLALECIGSALAGEIAALKPAAEADRALSAMKLQLEEDSKRALGVLRVVLSAPALSSQLIDNLNASAHLRCVLTDIFVLDEALQQHTRAGLARPA